MPRYVAFLRAINVGGAHTVRMDALRRIFEGLGFSNVTSYIASGNILFDTPARSTARLEQRIEGALIEALGREATPFVRTGPELIGIAGFRAFQKSAFQTGDQLGIIFLSAPPDAEAKAVLWASHSTAELFRVRGREIYWLRHRGLEGSVYPTVPLDKTLAQPFTIRSLNTVQTLVRRYFSHG